MSEDGYLLSESSVRKLAANDKRLAQIPHGDEGAPHSFQGEPRKWCWFRYAEFYRQNGTAGDSIAPGYSSALESGASNPGGGFLYWGSWFGDHRLLGLEMVRQDSYGNQWANVKRTGYFLFDMTLLGGYNVDPTMASQTKTSGPASAGTAHTHDMSNYYDTSRVRTARLDFAMQKRTTSGGAWSLADYSNTDDLVIPGNPFFQEGSNFQMIRRRYVIHLTAGWSIRWAFAVDGHYPSDKRNPFTLHRQHCEMLVENLGPGPSALKFLATYEVSP